MADETKTSITFLGIECARKSKGIYEGGRRGIGVQITLIATAPDSWSAHVTTRFGTLSVPGSGSSGSGSSAETVEMLEAAAREALSLGASEIAILRNGTNAGPTLAEAASRFIEDWSRLPSLVRAASAARLVKVSGQQANVLDGDVKLWKEVGAGSRRLRVTERFCDAEIAWMRLFLALMKEADDEAEKNGVDADPRYNPTYKTTLTVEIGDTEIKVGDKTYRMEGEEGREREEVTLRT